MLKTLFRCGLFATFLAAGCLAAEPVDGPPELDGNRAPKAVVSTGSDIPIGSTVTLAGQDSFDPDGDDLLYHWVVTPPVGAEAIEGTEADLSFDLAIAGLYVVALTVDDQNGHSDSTSVRLSAFVPVVDITIDAGSNATAAIFDTVKLAGSIDLNGTLETSYSWELLSRPPQSTTELVDTDTLEPSFLADRVGEYTIRLRVDSPWSRYESKVTVTAMADQLDPNVRYVDFDYSPAVGKFAGTSLVYSNNDRLQILDPTTWSSQEVAFPHPKGMRFSLDGSRIVLGYGTSQTPFSTAEVQTSSGAVLQTIVGLSPLRLEFAMGNQIVTSTSNALTTFNLTTHAETTVAGSVGPFMARATDAGDKFYSWRFNQPNQVARLEVTGSGPAVLGSRDLGTGCAPLWPSASGQFMISACGQILRVSSNATLDLTVLGSLSVTAIKAAVHAADLGLIIVANEEAAGYSLRAYDDVTYQAQWVRAMPDWYSPETSIPLYQLEPRALYMLPDGQTLLMVGAISIGNHRFLRFRL